jgi:CRP-like cAMP-binding protein
MDHPRTNSVLERLEPDTRRAIAPDLTKTELTQGQILADVRAVYFPLHAVVSFLVELSNGNTVETAMVGRDGAICADEAIHEGLSFNRVTVLVSGTALSISAARFRDFYSKHDDLRQVVAQTRSVFIAQAQQTAACNSVHHIEARLCRWLLQARDVAGDTIWVTQEKIAQMLAVQRATVSSVTHPLQEARLIQSGRGRIIITDVSGLQARACECYKNLKRYKEAAVGGTREAAE